VAEFDTKLRLDIERPNTYMRENGLTKKQFCKNFTSFCSNR